MDTQMIEELALNLLLLFSNRLELLLIGWIIFIFVRIVWSGLSKFISIILFPGTILYFTIKFYVARILGMRLEPMMVLRGTYQYTGAITRIRRISDVIIITTSNLVIAIILTYINFQLATIFINELTKTVFLWLGVSFFITGMPRESDFYTLLTTIWAIEPLGVVALLLSIAVFATGLQAYNFTVALASFFIYIIIVTIVLSTFKMPDTENIELENIILDEDFY